MLWNKNIPFKASFILRRTLRGKLPTNDKLTNFGIEPSKCFCCTDNSGMDRIQHTFTSGKFSAEVWRNFAATAGIEQGCHSLQQQRQHWCTTKANNAAHKMLLQATPIFICLNVRKNRFAVKYGGKTRNITRVKYEIYNGSYKMLGITFPHISCPS